MPRYPQANLAACMLPWSEDHQLDVDGFQQHVQSVIDDGYSSMYILGTAGEGYALGEARYRQVVDEFARLTVRDGLDPQVGVIGTSMEQVIERIGYAHSRGVRMFQISLPSWGALDEGEALGFFKAVCGAYPDSRFLHYNLSRAGRIIAGAEYQRIAERVPNLVATKNSSYDYARTADLLIHAGELQHFLLECNFAMGCTLGECSLLCSHASSFPRTTWRFFQAGIERDLDTLFRSTRFFYEVTTALVGECGRRMIDGAYDKAFVRLRHPHFPNRLLPPYEGMSEDDFARCRALFEQRYAHIL